MSVISRNRRRISIGMTSTLSAFILALVFTLSSGALTFAAGLVQISSDPFTNNTSNHKTEVEPDTFAFGNTIVSAFQQGRFFDGGGSDIGFATSTNGGVTWVHGSLPGTTPFSTPTGIWQRTSDASVAFDAKHNVWIISFLGLFPNGNTNEVDVLVSRSTNGGRTWSAPVVVNASGDFNDKNWTACDDTASSPFYGHCYTEFDDFSKLNLVQMSTSTDGGLTWGPAKTTPDNACVIGGQPVVQPNGTVVVPIDDCLGTAILSFTSTNGGNSWSAPVQLAGPMTLTWLPLTTQGFMVADYISTSIVPSAANATPVFEVASAPTIGKTCSNIQTGAPGSHCNQATFTSLETFVGGSNAATSVPTTNLARPRPTSSRQTA